MELSYIPSGATERRTVNAYIDRNAWGQPVIMGGDNPISLSEWRRLRCRVVKADRLERKALVRIGLG